MPTISQAPFEGKHVIIEFAMHREDGVDVLYFRAPDGRALRLASWPEFEGAADLPDQLEELSYTALKRNLDALGVAPETVEYIADSLFPDDFK